MYTHEWKSFIITFIFFFDRRSFLLLFFFLFVSRLSRNYLLTLIISFLIYLKSFVLSRFFLPILFFRFVHTCWLMIETFKNHTHTHIDRLAKKNIRSDCASTIRRYFSLPHGGYNFLYFLHFFVHLSQHTSHLFHCILSWFIYNINILI